MKYLVLICIAFIFVACSSSSPKPIDNDLSAQLPGSIAAHGIVCGGMMVGAGQSCAGETEYCHREIKDMCGAADATGLCREKPQICTMDYNPVCGCDNQTYPNECAANAKGISAAYKGVCE